MSTFEEKTDLVLEGLDRIREVAKFLKLSNSTIYGLMANGTLPSVKIGKSRRIPHRAVVELAAAMLTTRIANEA
jgi:excisionase family DNA binding protein